MFRKMPFLLLALILGTYFAFPFLSESFQSVLYGISLSLKSLIVFLLPFVVLALLFNTTSRLAKKATGWLLGTVTLLCLSNLLATLTSFGVGLGVYEVAAKAPEVMGSKILEPTSFFVFPRLITNTQALILGLVGGIGFGIFKPKFAEKVAVFFEVQIALILKLFMWILPPFLLGSLVKLMHEEILTQIVLHYGLIFGWIALAVFGYIGLVYLIACRGNFKKALGCIQNMLPALVAGFGSMSSAAAMPLTLIGVSKNTHGDLKAQSTIPMTVNIHLMGDCFAIPILAFAVMKTFGVAVPSFAAYAVFALYFVISKFSVAAVPGGGILVMLPILEQYLGFSSPMLSLITALYMLFDPVITAANILGNGGFALGIFSFAKKKEPLLSLFFEKANSKKDASQD